MELVLWMRAEAARPALFLGCCLGETGSCAPVCVCVCVCVHACARGGKKEFP